MGVFTSSLAAGAGFGLGIGAGGTLGTYAAAQGIGAIERAYNASYNNYRAQYFDPVVRADLNDLLVYHRLQPKEYPFPFGEEAKKNFFLRHKFFSCLLVMFIASVAQAAFMLLGGNHEAINMLYAMSFMTILVFLALLVMLVQKGWRSGKKYVKDTYAAQLREDGQQYWHIREYVRRCLDDGSMLPRKAIQTFCTTRLAQQFPDSGAEIEANADLYARQMGAPVVPIDAPARVRTLE